MSLTCPFVPSTVPAVIGQIVQSQTAAQFEATFPSTYHLPTGSFSFNWNGVLTGYVANVPAVVTADQLAAMQTAALPIT